MYFLYILFYWWRLFQLLQRQGKKSFDFPPVIRWSVHEVCKLPAQFLHRAGKPDSSYYSVKFCSSISKPPAFYYRCWLLGTGLTFHRRWIALIFLFFFLTLKCKFVYSCVSMTPTIAQKLNMAIKKVVMETAKLGKKISNMIRRSHEVWNKQK